MPKLSEWWGSTSGLGAVLAEAASKYPTAGGQTPWHKFCSTHWPEEQWQWRGEGSGLDGLIGRGGTTGDEEAASPAAILGRQYFSAAREP